MSNTTPEVKYPCGDKTNHQLAELAGLDCVECKYIVTPAADTVMEERECASGCGCANGLTFHDGECVFVPAPVDPAEQQSGCVARIMTLLRSGRTEGGEAITSAKHAASVIERDILSPAPAQQQTQGEKCRCCGKARGGVCGACHCAEVSR